jgi:hypothetical protein
MQILSKSCGKAAKTLSLAPSLQVIKATDKRDTRKSLRRNTPATSAVHAGLTGTQRAGGGFKMETHGVHAVQLQTGDYIEAWHNGKLFHQGRVTVVVPKLDLFWILDARTGTRRLLDPEALVIVRVSEPRAATHGGAASAEPMPA